MYRVFVKTTNGIVTSINSNAFLPDTKGWTQIDSGDGDKYHHAQGNYLPKPIMTKQGAYQYKLENGKVVERTAEEIKVDIALIPPLPQTLEQRIVELEKQLAALKPTVDTLSKDVTSLKTMRAL